MIARGRRTTTATTATSAFAKSTARAYAGRCVTGRRARVGRAERPSIDGDDVLGWAFYKNGRCGEALAHSRRALRLGTHDALKIFHRGMIELCLGRRAEGRTSLAQEAARAMLP